MNIKKLFSFKGRINRKKYLFYQLIFPILLIPVFFFNTDNLVLNLTSLCLNLIFIVIVTSKSVQRLHDMNLPGIVILVPFILGALGEFFDMIIFQMIVLGFNIHLMVKKGTIGPNKYGDDPLATSVQTEEPIVDSE